MYENMWVWDHNWYWVDTSGAVNTSKWIGNAQWNEWYWLSADGKMSSNEWLDQNGARYRTSLNGVRYFDCWAQIDGKMVLVRLERSDGLLPLDLRQGSQMVLCRL